MSKQPSTQYRISWIDMDWESKLGIRASRFTQVNNLLCFILAIILTVLFYGIISRFPNLHWVQWFTERGVFQYVTVVVSLWAFVTLLLKSSKIKLQKKALGLTEIVPSNPSFFLSPATVEPVLGQIRTLCKDPDQFILTKRIQTALANLKNIGRVGDLDDVLESLANNDEEIMENSYTVLKGLIWMIPVLGFIGTVQGLGDAIGSFGGVLSTASSIEEIKPELQKVTSGLATAFDTTFVALVAALLIQLISTLVRKSEEELMTGCRGYCQTYLLTRIRLMPLSH
jgi:hypothetical protein